MHLSKSHALDKKVNAGKGRKLSKAEQAHKTRNWPRGPVNMEHERKLMGKDS